MMTKMIHTIDIFNNKTMAKGQKYLDFCLEKALQCGLAYKCYTGSPFAKLELWGSKHAFVKYYFVTLLKCDNKMDGIKRLVSIMRT